MTPRLGKDKYKIMVFGNQVKTSKYNVTMNI